MIKQPLDEKNQALVVEHIVFAKQLAAQFYQERSNLGFDREDFEGAAMLGLCDAARRYDPAKAEFFRTFCYFRVRGAMFDLCRTGAGVQRRQFNQIVANRKLAEAGEPEASSKTEVDKSPSKPSQLPYSFANSSFELAGLINVLDGLSMKLHVSDIGTVELTYADALSPEEAAVIKNTKSYLDRLLAALPTRERELIERHYFDGQSLSEIGRGMGGISRSWMCRLHQSAITKLQNLVSQDTARYVEHETY